MEIWLQLELHFSYGLASALPHTASILFCLKNGLQFPARTASITLKLGKLPKEKWLKFKKVTDSMEIKLHIERVGKRAKVSIT